MSSAATAPTSGTATSKAPASQEENMVVRLSQLDKMLELAGEVIIVSSNLGAISRQTNTGALVSREMYEDFKDLAITSNRISSDLHRLVVEVRTVDMTNLFARFRRLTRDASRRVGKAIRFEAIGEDIFIDKRLSEKIHDPIAHLIRNAVAHGIEAQSVREAAGKDPVGAVSVRLLNENDAIVFQVKDDGAGIDLDAIRRKSVEQGLITEQAAAVANAELLYDCMFKPGFSTAQSTSNTAGRGVGLDVVRNVADQLDGDVRVESVPGQGTTFSLVVPKITAVNISDSLVVNANGILFSFPITSVIATASMDASSVTTAKQQGRAIMHLGRLLPLFDLMEIFGEPGVQYDEHLQVIIVEHKHRQLAFVVSEFLSPQKIVISEFDVGLRVMGLVGTAVLSGRKLAMVVDLPRLFELAFGSEMDSSGTEPDPTDQLFDEEESCEAQPGQDPSETKTSAPRTSPPEVALPVEVRDSAFLLEVDSMLGELNRQLLELDETRDLQVADGVFRLAHSIKGNLTMYGAEESASLTHKLENILAAIKSEKIEMTSEVFDVFFDGFAAIEEVVSSLLKGTEPPRLPEAFLQRLETFDRPVDSASGGRQIDVDKGTIELDSVGQFYLTSRRKQGVPLYQCLLDFDASDQPRFLVAYLILQRLQERVDILGCLPSMTDIENGLCESGVKVLFADTTGQKDTFAQLETHLRRHYGVKRFDVTSYS